MPDFKTTNKLEKVFCCRGAKIRGLEGMFEEGKLCLVPLMWAGPDYHVASSVALFVIGPLASGWACLCSIGRSSPLLPFCKGFFILLANCP